MTPLSSTAAAPALASIEPSRTPATPQKEIDPKTLEAAREFEAIFVREMLKSLEKTTQLGGKGSLSSGGSVYSSMIVDSLADSISAGGGLGMADVVARALTEGATRK